ncbi:MAG TPA: aromatic ring-hydroxylating dioxygenase subunit alpha [Baekduia sp.]|uniref:aromatic ring-hydroxylating oxygenase subunit alpha n=1 Tax=Baekduia sp. TaxID=2600305 RepID=UPI002D7794EE|nr:aromatic ring-hydroxylating dioxygenase subunit alpha [Baekduia sp.]HET6505870.1 aromatic ring-hydroxylating dioxygenase subunit alpha [Baekduia sp.]
MSGARHAALDAIAYSDPARSRAEIATIFRTTWQVAVLARDVARPGSYATAEIGGMPVVLTRDRDGVLRGFRNVCPHRAMILADGTGPAKLLQCPNHAWTFTLQGRLRHAPRADREPSFRADGLDLRPVAVREWGPLVLVNVDADAAPPTAELDAMGASIAAAGMDLDGLVPVGPVYDWDIAANWKIVCENYLECYHCAVVHPSFSKVFDVSADRYALAPAGDLLSATAPVKDTRKLDEQQAVLATRSGPVEESLWHLLFPAMTINIYPGEGAFEATWYWPVDAHTTRGRTAVFLPEGATEEYARQVTELSLRVGEEDNALCEAMHRGMASGAIERGRLMEDSEALLVRFQRRVRELMGEA